jgi:hypothetical protein
MFLFGGFFLENGLNAYLKVRSNHFCFQNGS